MVDIRNLLNKIKTFENCTFEQYFLRDIIDDLSVKSELPMHKFKELR